MVDVVTITRERFDDLNKKEDFLAALEDAGVDNWEGYDIAQDTFEEWNKEG